MTLKGDYTCVNVSFFDGENNEVYWLSDYVDYIESIIKQLRDMGIIRVVVVGHSFGGRVGIRLAAKGKIDKLMLIDSAGLKPRLTVKKVWRKCVYKLKKLLNLNMQNCGSSDYIALSPSMKKTFVNIVNTYQDHEAKLIAIPTLIMWGEKDRDTPIYMAKKLSKLINNSGLYIIKNAGHYSYLDKQREYLSGLKEFLKQ